MYQKRFLLVISAVLFVTASLIADWETIDYSTANGKLWSNNVQNVFFYDTRNDLDGGAWRNDNQTSWYNAGQYSQQFYYIITWED